MQHGRNQQGRFVYKSDAERQVRSIRATDSTWEAFGQYADEVGMTRADLLEHLIMQWQQDSSFQPLAPEPEKLATETAPGAPKEPEKPASITTPVKPVTSKPAKAKPSARYYLQLSYRTKHRWEKWYWDGSELIHKSYGHLSEKAKVYSSKSAAIAAAKKLQKHVDRFAGRVGEPANLLSLRPVRVTW